MKQRKRLGALHLLWAIPITAVIQYWAAVYAVLAWCGLYGCGASGVYASSNPWLSSATVVASTVLVNVVLILAPWTTGIKPRVIGASTISVLLAVVMLVLAANL